jgi:hypothetical protein
LFLPPTDRLAGLIPPLMALKFFPSDVAALFWSAPAFFAFVVAWRVRRLRRDQEGTWLLDADVHEPELRLFEAGALPVAAAALVLAVTLPIVSTLWVAVGTADPAESAGLGSQLFAISRLLLIVSLTSGILSAHRELSKGIGQLLGAGFFVWGIHLGIAFSVPWMTNWWTYLPIPFLSRLGGEPSANLVHLLFNLAVVAGTWAALREKLRSKPFWEFESQAEEA